tara:strand:+ start:14305 stop:15060 length:756 start_codon:yes stop_codon:yes gene_type:complete
MGIFKSFTKILKKAAPIIGGSIGFAIAPGFLGAALGSGIGSLVGGADPEDALKAAALGGIAGYAGSKFMAPTAEAVKGTTPVAFGMEAASAPTVSAVSTTPLVKEGIMSSVLDFAKSPVGIASIVGAGGLAALGGEEEETTKKEERPFPKGTSRLGRGMVDGLSFDLNDKEERDEYFRRVRAKQGFEKEFELAGGGEVEGPGTGTSDSVPARLSDGEFVLTAKAVRGAGGGDRDIGAARMYDMMSELERVA